MRRWIWRQGWSGLRDIQARAIPVLLEGRRDAVIAAATASGKTEAAFLPIVSRIASAAGAPPSGFDALYVSPLRALINDQFRRVESLCGDLDIPVFKWHGDVGQAAKNRARRARHGIVLITPESLEAILVRRGGEARGLFKGLTHVVIDELHAFFDAPRGKQLQSLLVRLEAAAGRRIPRVGLSATLADLSVAAAFLRPNAPDGVAVVESQGSGLRLMLQVRGYLDPLQPPKADGGDGGALPGTADRRIARDMFESLRGGKNLIFAGSRRQVEIYSAALNDLSEEAGVPGEFLPHHGSLSRDLREEAEARMKRADRPATIVCTTTLELGIDVGAIEAVAQIGPGHTVAGMRQRLGRSGRREGAPAVLRVYVPESELGALAHPLDALRPTLLQTVAMVELLLKRWVEPSGTGEPHLSTLAHQILALIGQHGGVTPRRAFDCLVRGGAFADVDAALFKKLLRRMGDPRVGLIEQAPDGVLLPGREGERLLASYAFFAVFDTPKEYRLVCDGKTLGSLPAEHAPLQGDYILFAGRRWQVVALHAHRGEIEVVPARTGKAPRFGGGTIAPHDAVVAEMRRLYEDAGVPAYLDPGARALLREGRETFARLGLARRPILADGHDTLVFPWVGGRRQEALLLALAAHGLKTEPTLLALQVAGSAGEVLSALARIAGAPDPDPVALAARVRDRCLDKYDVYLGDELQTLGYASRRLDTVGLARLARRLMDAVGG